ncbi:MAG: glycosyltransferase [Desulfovibrionaceae bacterium]|nr:glycosyltransferase [Desulfovibrionaceae bacterium]MBF0513842.1 glycosyltransferase [Desulfovibrionaceae bacterium]
MPNASEPAPPAAGVAPDARKRLGGLQSPVFETAFGYKKFAAEAPRILLLQSGYFLYREIKAALGRLRWPLATVDIPSGAGATAFIERFLETVCDFKPDFALTVNHLGLDREGALTALLERLRLPLASWFVDSPRLILHDYSKLASPYAAIFAWDKGSLPGLKDFGFEHVAYLPLGTDEIRFAPRPADPASPASPADSFLAAVSFVGDSMVRPVAQNAAKLAGHPKLIALYRELARDYAVRPEREVRELLKARHPKAFAAYLALPGDEPRLALELLVTWEATRITRLNLVKRLLPFSPLIVGDEGWKESLAGRGKTWRWRGPVDYYRELPDLYRACDINFNCTSQQMKGAVNQRVFDVPACGAFVLTDEREQLAELFEIGKEAIVYRGPEEVEDLARYYLSHESERVAVAMAGRARVLAEHTYVHRLRTLGEAMRAIYS